MAMVRLLLRNRTKHDSLGLWNNKPTFPAIINAKLIEIMAFWCAVNSEKVIDPIIVRCEDIRNHKILREKNLHRVRRKTAIVIYGHIIDARFCYRNFKFFLFIRKPLVIIAGIIIFTRL
jgi:hypothetical protein